MLCACRNVACRLFLREEQAGGLDDVLCADFVPLQVRRILLRGDADGLAVHDQRILGIIDRTLEAAMDCIILEHVRHVIRSDQVVDADDLDLGVVDRSAEHETADTAKAIDTNFDSHKE